MLGGHAAAAIVTAVEAYQPPLLGGPACDMALDKLDQLRTESAAWGRLSRSAASLPIELPARPPPERGGEAPHGEQLLSHPSLRHDRRHLRACLLFHKRSPMKQAARYGPSSAKYVS